MPSPSGDSSPRPVGTVANTVSWVDLTASNFDFSKAKSDGSDLRVYDVDGDAVLPVWLMDYSQAGQSGRLYFLASNVAHQHRLYYGNPSASAVSSHSAVFTGGSGFDADFGDLTTSVAASGYASQVPESSGLSDARNYRVWSLAEGSTLAYADTHLGGTYTGVREASLVRDAVTNTPLLIGGKYYITFARRSDILTDKFDCVLASGPTTDGPWSDFSVFFTPPGTVRLGYPSSCIKVGSTYVLHIGYGWSTLGGRTPALTMYVMTSTDLATWTSPVKAFDQSIFTDQASGGACTDGGNGWVIRCADGTYMMVLESTGASDLWGCFGATTTDPINGPWTALNSGAALLSLPTVGQWDHGGFNDANPKIFQQADGSYVMPFNGSDNPTGTIADWQLGFATASNRGGPWTKAAYNPIGGRFTPSYGFEMSAFHLDTDGTTLFNWAQRYGDSGTSSNSAKIYRLGALLKRGGLLVAPTPNDAASMGRSMAAGTFTAESRSVFTAHRATAAAPVLIGLWDYAAMPSAAANAGFTAQRRVEAVRWSHDTVPGATQGPGDVTFRYYDSGGTAHYWNGSAWTTSTTGRNLPADHGREVVAAISDDGTNFILSAYYADDGTSIGSASIAKATVKAFSSGRLLFAGDPFTDAWGSGLFYRYLHTRPYAASDPTLALGAEVGAAVTAPTTGRRRLLEDGSFRLLEDGSFRLLESGITSSVGTQAVIAQYFCSKNTIDYTPTFAVGDGDVIDLGDFIGVARRAIPAGVLGTLAVRGVFRFFKAPGETISRGDYVYWDGSQATGVIGYSSATIGRCVLDSASSDLYVRAFLTPGVG